jgi:hypothetical protein
MTHHEKLLRSFKDWVKRHNVRVGTRVKPVRGWGDDERGYRGSTFDSFKLKYIGTEQTISTIYYEHGDVVFAGSCGLWPFFCLKVCPVITPDV